MDMMRIARRVALTHIQTVTAGHKPDGALEKMIGEMTLQQLGIDDAPKQFFDRVKRTVGKVDLDDDGTYRKLLRAIIDTAQAMDMIEDRPAKKK